MLLKDKVVLVTGASQGIGKAAAIGCARHGADVAINYLPAEEPDAQDVADLIEADAKLEPNRQLVICTKLFSSGDQNT